MSRPSGAKPSGQQGGFGVAARIWDRQLETGDLDHAVPPELRIWLVLIAGGIADDPRVADHVVHAVVGVPVDPQRRLIALDDSVEVA